MKKVTGLGLCLMLSPVLVGSVLLSLSVMNVALAVNMPDAPVTQDTVTAGEDGTDDNEDDEDDRENDQPDDLPDPEECTGHD
jgi:hypothetical protein